jgi:type II secretory pathway pseudopilin PulG
MDVVYALLNILVSAAVAWVTSVFSFRRQSQQKRIESIESALEEYSIAGIGYWSEGGSLPADERNIMQWQNRLSARLDAYFKNARNSDKRNEVDLSIDELHALMTGDDSVGNAFKSPARTADPAKRGLIKSKTSSIRAVVGSLPVSTKNPFGWV